MKLFNRIFRSKEIEGLKREIGWLRTDLWRSENPKKFRCLDKVRYSRVEGDKVYVISSGGYSATYSGMDICPNERYYSYSLIDPDTRAVMYSAKEKDLTLVDD